MAKTSEVIMYGGGATAVVAGNIGIHEIAAIIGAIVAVAGFAVNLWFRIAEYKQMKQRNGDKE